MYSPRPTDPPGERNPGVSLSNELFLGTLRWDLLHPFPTQDDADRRVGDEHVIELTEHLRANVDPTQVDTSRELPAELVEVLRAKGYLRLLVDRKDGGLGLSPYNAFRLIETAASWSIPVANVMSTGNGWGAGAYLRMLPEGPLREVIREHVVEGNFSGRADTEPAGAGNSRQNTTATPAEGGDAYLLNGEKVFIGNGTVADLLDVTATVVDDGVPSSASFFVDTTTPGLEVVTRQDFMGLGGAPIANLMLTDVRVPRSLMLSGAELDGFGRGVKEFIYLARTLGVVPPSLAIAKLCLAWQREFVNRRRVDDRPLAAYEAIERAVALSVADTFAIESFTRWTMLGRGADLLHEHAALKNIASLTCWRVLDRTVGLLGGEGLETAASKARRGTTPLPVERFYRDARGLRVLGGVDFLVDYLAGRIRLTDCYYDRTYTPVPGDALVAARRAVAEYDAEHVEFVTEQAARLGRECRKLTQRHLDREDLFARQHAVITLNRIANELLTMASVLARSAAGDDEPALASVYCADARPRLVELWAQLDAGGQDHADVTARWLDGRGYETLLGDAVTALPDR
ncbi:acyl-CoA/acyl-ACP dehydrogenase [Streptomyces sp. WMMC500]|uniref:acyl-CoA dehydrogenase family protein n=1 Tax=Streptomyces sp. WMMC500 TaxID=3015154 RepID=UPI00248BF4DF|nr:acyl-CoA dehydrogenase family protein [Streptomyces sp. WMMC500]WBB62050.1 acyl-CoA/acyl-ACP dehydrogenase [Streptomyces sp. WMMC500]